MKYPLTDEAKQAAKMIVEAWNKGILPQRFRVAVNSGDNREDPFLYEVRSFESPPFAIWTELSAFGLVYINQNDKSWEITLFQELRNAVNSDFEVSDYFITMNAVGNIIINSTTGPVQGVGYTTGNVIQNTEQLADYIDETLGSTFLQAHTELKAAIDALRESTEADQQPKLGKVISELGNCLQHGANTATVVAAISAATPVIQKLLGA